MTLNIKQTEIEPISYTDKHIRKIDKKSWDTINKMRILRKYTWQNFFDHLYNYKKEFEKFLFRSQIQGIASVKSMQTISVLLPKWCDNIANNMEDILKSGDISCLVCKTRKDNKCQKIEKMKCMVFDKEKEYELSEIAKECGFPNSIMEYMLRQIYTYNFIPIAGSHICIDCSDKVKGENPALIIGAGPSLTNEHLELLHKYGFNGDIFVVGKSLKPLLDNNIIPKYVGTLDAEEFDTSFFDHDIVDKYSDQVTGLFGITTHPTTQKRWKGNRHYFAGYISESETPNISHIFHLMTKTSNISVSGNIGSCLYNIAAYMGYNPLVMIGMDLSFPSLQSMKDYFPNATDDDWNRTITVGDKESPMYKRRWNPEFKTQYYMDSVFESYKISHLSWTKSLAEQGIKTINCSEQGSIHSDYVTSLKFEEFLKNQDKYTKLLQKDKE